jgi:hypothetical protein
MQSALERLDRADAVLAGAVLSGVTSGQYSYEYGNYMQRLEET